MNWQEAVRGQGDKKVERSRGVNGMDPVEGGLWRGP